MKLSIAVPFYNEEKCIEAFFNSLLDVLAKAGYLQDYEIIAVNDGSKDSTLSKLTEIANKNKKIKIVDLSRNFGHQVAISAGISFASGDATVLMDGDLQDPPMVIPDFVKKWREGFSVVYGIRKNRKEFFLKKICYFLFYRVQEKLSKIKIPLDAGDFCLMDKGVVDLLKKMPERNRFIRGMRSWVGFPQAGIEFERDFRFSGKPKYGLRKLFRLAFDGIYSFSEVPLKLSLIFGFLISIFCFLFMIFIIYQRLAFKTSIYGMATAIVAVLFLGGIQLIAIGVIGEYIGRIYDEVKQRPIFVVKQLINF